MPGLLEPVIHRMATAEERANLSQTYAGIIACGVFVFENFEAYVKWSRAKKSAGKLTNSEQTYLYDPNELSIRSPLLLDRPREVTVTIDPETAERLEELGEVWSVSQAALLRSAIIAGISQDRGYVDRSLVDICIFETKWLDKHLSQELEVRMQLIELTRQYDSESEGR